jgi:hypothetical protein
VEVPYVTPDVELQESNLRLTQNFLQNWIGQVNNQAQGIREAAQGLQEQGQRQREAFETLSQEATNAYSEFLNSAIWFYQEALNTAESPYSWKSTLATMSGAVRAPAVQACCSLGPGLRTLAGKLAPLVPCAYSRGKKSRRVYYIPSHTSRRSCEAPERASHEQITRRALLPEHTPRGYPRTV